MNTENENEKQPVNEPQQPVTAEENLPEGNNPDIGEAEAQDNDNLGDSPEEKALREAREWKDKYFRLYAEFDNFRKRSQREKVELIQGAGGDVIKDLLPVLDDFERAVKANESLDNLQAVKEGFLLIQQKMQKITEARGLRPIVSTGETFDVDFHEAITNIPAPDPSLKGKVMDTVEKGYLYNDKVLRFAKVVVGA